MFKVEKPVCLNLFFLIPSLDWREENIKWDMKVVMKFLQGEKNGPMGGCLWHG